MSTPESKIEITIATTTSIGCGTGSVDESNQRFDTATFLQNTQTVYPRTGTTAALPPEILRIIFEYVQSFPLSIRRILHCRDPTSYGYDFAVNIVCGQGICSLQNNLFEVCRYWTEVFKSVPTFWTHVLAFAGPDFEEEDKDVSHMLRLSRDRPFDLVILGSQSSDAAEEGDRKKEEDDIRSILEQVNPHLHRCKSIFIATKFVTPLPLIHQHLTGYAPLLTSAIVQTSGQDRIERSEYEQYPCLGREYPLIPFRPSLESLFIDGPNLHEAAEYERILSSLAGLRSLAIRNYRSHKHLAPLYVYEVLSYLDNMPHLQSLKFEDTDFLVSEDPHFVELEITSVIFSKMQLNVIQEFFDCCAFIALQQLWIAQSWAHESYIPRLCPIIFLEDLPAANAPGPALKNWLGQCVVFTDCESFDDQTLAMFASPVDPLILDADVDENTEFHCCNLLYLTIQGCHNFTVAGLKDMVGKRGRWMNYDDPNWKALETAQWPQLALKGLEVRDVDHILSAEDADWFSSRLVSFSWCYD